MIFSKQLFMENVYIIILYSLKIKGGFSLNGPEK
jgi:hypothetical protein